MSTDGAIDTRILRRLDAGRIYNQQTESIGKMAGRGGDDEMGGQEQRMNADNIWLKLICPSHHLPSLAALVEQTKPFQVNDLNGKAFDQIYSQLSIAHTAPVSNAFLVTSFKSE